MSAFLITRVLVLTRGWNKKVFGFSPGKVRHQLVGLLHRVNSGMVVPGIGNTMFIDKFKKSVIWFLSLKTNNHKGHKEMNYPAAELRSIKMEFYLINPDAKHRGILLIKFQSVGRV
jgi:hypothetical protein